MKIGVLAVQGAFIEHEKVLDTLGVPYKELRCAKDLDEDIDGLILPGGESTVQGKLLKELDMFSPLLEKIRGGLPVLATCAGMILLATALDQGQGPHFATLPMTVRRNAYGRQLGSFRTTAPYKGLGELPMTFIRAPYVLEAGDGAQVMATVDDHIVAVEYGKQIALAFHPELDNDTRLHERFIDLCR